jgi:hypothetical protein
MAVKSYSWGKVSKNGNGKKRQFRSAMQTSGVKIPSAPKTGLGAAKKTSRAKPGYSTHKNRNFRSK